MSKPKELITRSIKDFKVFTNYRGERQVEFYASKIGVLTFSVDDSTADYWSTKIPSVMKQPKIYVSASLLKLNDNSYHLIGFSRQDSSY